MHNTIVPEFHKVLPQALCLAGAAALSAAGAPSIAPVETSACEAAVRARRDGANGYVAAAEAVISNIVTSDATTYATFTDVTKLCTEAAKAACEAQAEQVCGADIKSANPNATQDVLDRARALCHGPAQAGCANAVDATCLIAHHALGQPQ